jgi:plastocyanin
VIRLAALAFVVAACATSGAGASPVATDRVDLPRSYRFAPAAIIVAAGTTVTWTNSDNFTHSVQFPDEPAPGQVMRPGEQATRTFTQTGTFDYVCTFHPQDMTATVTISGS